jgi:magnesium-transporting ATPase (P-type)
MYDLPEFALSQPELAALFPNGLASELDRGAVDPAKCCGLSAEGVAASHARHGLNTLSPPPSIPAWRRFVRHLTTPLQVLMLIASALSWISFGLTGDYRNAVLAGVLMFAVVVNALEAQAQENAASNVAAALHSLMPGEAHVQRGGEETKVAVKLVAVGDLVHLVSGMRVPADIVLLSGRIDLDLSSLTGESLPLSHTPVARSTLLFEARSVAFSGSLVLAGDAWGLVCKVGDATFIGSTTQSLGERTGETELDAEMRRVGLMVAALALVIGFSLLAVGLGRGLGVVFSIVNAFVLVL